MPSSPPISVARLLQYSLKLVRRTQMRIESRLRLNPEAALQRINDPKKDPNNQPLRIDYYAEDYYGGGLEKRFRGRIVAVGEETLKQRPDLRDLTGQNGIFAVMDIIDGTDLLIRRLGNWCSAVVCFTPGAESILLSLVADHDGNVFWALEGKDVAYFLPKGGKSIDQAIPLHQSSCPLSREEAIVRMVRHRPSGPLASTHLKDASVCFVGQKPHHFLNAAENRSLVGKLNEFRALLETKVKPAPGFRIYNLGGIPMMPKLAVGILDAVIGLKGSRPHDFVAGAHIALKSGACLGDLAGSPITEKQLIEYLSRPDADCPPYIIASNAALYSEIVETLGGAASAAKA